MSFTIGQVAQAADVNVQTIRYYERRGLFPSPARTRSGYRQYGEDAVARLRFIKHAQELGFSLKEIQELLGLRVRHVAACGPIERKTRQKIEVVHRKIEDLQRMKRTLERLAAACAARQPTEDCPILEALEDDSSKDDLRKGKDDETRA
jgi:MerR family transcriptional regulator, copper efflux regulator